MHSRRRFLALIGVTTPLGLAGCLGGDADESPDGDNHDTGGDEEGDTDENDNGQDPPDDGRTTDEHGDVPDSFTDASPEAFESYAREFLELLAAEDFETAHAWFSAKVGAELSVDALETAWRSDIETTDSDPTFQTVEYRGPVTDPATGMELEVVVVQAAFEETHRFELSFAEDGLGGFWIRPVAEWTPPQYVDESSFTEVEVSLDATQTCSLGGTLSIPGGETTVPGVVIVHGSGSMDRDGTVGPNRTYKELAWGLASEGIAVLRYDKRTFACDVDRSSLSIDDVVTDDALLALDRLREHDRVDAESVFVVGHSLGATLTPRIVDRDGAVAGAVLLAPGGRPLSELVVDQYEYLLTLDGDLSESEREQLDAIEETADRVSRLDIEEDEVVWHLGGREYFESIAAYDGPATAATLDVSLQISYGERDYQATVDDDLPVWRDTLEDDPTVEFETYEQLNHHFQSGSGPSSPGEYIAPDAFVAQSVVFDIEQFVTNRD